MKSLSILAILAIVSLQAGLSQDSKPVPLPFHREISPVEFLEREMHSFPIEVGRLYALYERDKREFSTEEASQKLISRLRLTLKGVFSSQQRAVEFSVSNAQNGRGLPRALLSEYQDRIESGWYEDMLNKPLSADQIVGLLNAEQQSWKKYRNPTDKRQHEDSSREATRSSDQLSAEKPVHHTELPSSATSSAKAVTSLRSPVENSTSQPTASSMQAAETGQSPSLFPIGSLAILAVAVLGLVVFLLKRKRP